MRTHVEFSSDAFPAAPGEEEMVNRGRWGRKLAEYLRRELDRAGLRPGEIRAEDWGWVVPIENEGFPLWVGCGNYDARSDGFLCFVEPSTPFVRKLFRKVETKSRVSRVAEVLDEILVSHSGVWDLRWW